MKKFFKRMLASCLVVVMILTAAPLSGFVGLDLSWIGSYISSLAANDKTYKIVLTWGANPADLDSHIEGPLSNGGSFHVYYQNKNAYDNGVKVANLDTDDTTGYGPETITLKPTVAGGVYNYYIKRFSGSGTLANSGATVKLYENDKLIGTYTPPKSGSGDYWNLFNIKDGSVVVINKIASGPITQFYTDVYGTIQNLQATGIQIGVNAKQGDHYVPANGAILTIYNGFGKVVTSTEVKNGVASFSPEELLKENLNSANIYTHTVSAHFDVGDGIELCSEDVLSNGKWVGENLGTVVSTGAPLIVDEPRWYVPAVKVLVNQSALEECKEILREYSGCFAQTTNGHVIVNNFDILAVNDDITCFDPDTLIAITTGLDMDFCMVKMDNFNTNYSAFGSVDNESYSNLGHIDHTVGGYCNENIEGLLFCPIIPNESRREAANLLCHESGHYFFGFWDEYCSVVGALMAASGDYWIEPELKPGTDKYMSKYMYAYDENHNQVLDKGEDSGALWTPYGFFERPKGAPKNYGVMDKCSFSIEMSTESTYDPIEIQSVTDHTFHYWYTQASCEEKLAHELAKKVEGGYAVDYTHAEQTQTATYPYAGGDNVNFKVSGEVNTYSSAESFNTLSVEDSVWLENICDFNYFNGGLNITSDNVVNITIKDFIGNDVVDTMLDESNGFSYTFMSENDNIYYLTVKAVVDGLEYENNYTVDFRTLKNTSNFNNEKRTVNLYSDDEIGVIVINSCKDEKTMNGEYSSLSNEYTILSESDVAINGNFDLSVQYDLDIDYSTISWFIKSDNEWLPVETNSFYGEHNDLCYSGEYSGNGTYCLMAKEAKDGTSAAPSGVIVANNDVLYDKEVSVTFEDLSEDVLYYNIYYGTEPITKDNYLDMPKEKAYSGSNGMNITLDNSSTTYYFAVQAVFVDGSKSELSESVSGKGAAKDSDGDGIPDSWINCYSLSDAENVATVDSDGDELTNLEEYQRGTNPLDVDTDGDNVYDAMESMFRLDPTNPMTDGKTDDYLVAYGAPDVYVDSLSITEDKVSCVIGNSTDGKAMRSRISLYVDDKLADLYTVNLDSNSSVEFSFSRDLIANYEKSLKIIVDDNRITRDTNYNNNTYTILKHGEFDTLLKEDEISVIAYLGNDVDVTIPNEISGYPVTEIDKGLFNSRPGIQTVNIPATVTDIDLQAFSQKEALTDINVSEDNERYSSVDGVLLGQNGEELLFYPSGKSLSYYVPDGIKIINENAFGSVNMETIVIPKSVEEIQEDALDCEAQLGCYLNSFAQSYLTDNGFEFVLVDALNIRDKSLVAIDHDNQVIHNIRTTAQTLTEALYVWKDYTIEYNIKDSTPITGDSVKVFDTNGTLIMEYTFVIFGDVNQDGLSDGADAVYLDCIVSGMIEEVSLSRGVFLAADCDRDGQITKDDVTLLSEAGIFLNNVPQLYAHTMKYQYNVLENGSVEITGMNNPTESIYIPTRIDGYKVESIAEGAFSDNDVIQEVEIASGVEKIEPGALPELDVLRIPVSIKELDQKSLRVQELHFSGSESSFYELIATGEEIEDYFFNELYCNGQLCKNRYYIIDNEVYVYYNQSTETEIIVPSTLGKYPITSVAFNECQNLANVVIPDGVTNLDYAFYNCGTIGKLTIPKSVTSMVNICGEYDDTHVTEVGYEGTEDEWYSLLMNGADYTNIFYDKLYCEGKLCDATYHIYDGKAEAYYSQSEATEIVVPSTIGGYPVTRVGFSECKNLANVVIPDGVTNLDGAFYNCGTIGKLTVPKSVTSMNYICGDYDTHVTEVCYEGTEDEWYSLMMKESDYMDVFYDKLYCNGKLCEASYYIYDGEAEAYYNQSEATEIVVPSAIGGYPVTRVSFSKCKNLANVVIPEGVTNLDGAFYNCGTIGKLTIPKSVTSMNYICGDYDTYVTEVYYEGTEDEWYSLMMKESDYMDVFYDKLYCNGELCEASYYIYDGKAEAYYSQSEATEIVIPASIGGYPITGVSLYQCRNLEMLYISEGITTIDSLSIGDCPLLDAIYIPASVENIPPSAFTYLDPTITIVIDENNNYYKSVDGIVFNKGMTELIRFPAGYGNQSYVLPDTVTVIAESAFEGCDKLTDIVLPDNLTSIGDSAFSGCSSLTSIEIPDGVTTIGTSAFEGCESLTSIIIPASVSSIGTTVFSRCNSLANIYVSAGNTSYSSANDIIYNADKTTLITCAGGKSGAVSVPDTVSKIAERAFYECTQITSITLPSSLRTIEKYAFSRSGIETIVIPEGVTSIGGDAFANCPNLVSVSLPGTVTEIGTWLFWSCDELKTVTLGEGITKISSRMFYDCPKLTDINIPQSVNTIEYGAFEDCGSLEQITIPSGVTKIDRYVFSGCASLSTVEIPNTVTKIDSYAFEDCTALTSIYIPSSVTEISSSAFRDTTVTIRCDSGSKAYDFAIANNIPYEIV